MELNQKIFNWELLPIFEENLPTVEDFKGKPLLIVFFNLGCPGCKGRALPYANRIAYENEDNINVVGIHTRFEGPEYRLEDFQKAKEDYSSGSHFIKMTDKQILLINIWQEERHIGF